VVLLVLLVDQAGRRLEGAEDDEPRRAWSKPGKVWSRPGKAWIELRKVQTQRKSEHSKQNREHREDKRVVGNAAPIHCIAEKRSSRKLGFRHTGFSETQELPYNVGREVHPTEEGGGMKHAY
jgi:hypothetical protein